MKFPSIIRLLFVFNFQELGLLSHVIIIYHSMGHSNIKIKSPVPLVSAQGKGVVITFSRDTQKFHFKLTSSLTDFVTFQIPIKNKNCVRPF